MEFQFLQLRSRISSINISKKKKNNKKKKHPLFVRLENSILVRGRSRCRCVNPREKWIAEAIVNIRLKRLGKNGGVNDKQQRRNQIAPLFGRFYTYYVHVRTHTGNTYIYNQR